MEHRDSRFFVWKGELRSADDLEETLAGLDLVEDGWEPVSHTIEIRDNELFIVVLARPIREVR